MFCVSRCANPRKGVSKKRVRSASNSNCSAAIAGADSSRKKSGRSGRGGCNSNRSTKRLVFETPRWLAGPLAQQASGDWIDEGTTHDAQSIHSLPVCCISPSSTIVGSFALREERLCRKRCPCSSRKQSGLSLVPCTPAPSSSFPSGRTPHQARDKQTLPPPVPIQGKTSTRPKPDARKAKNPSKASGSCRSRALGFGRKSNQSSLCLLPEGHPSVLAVVAVVAVVKQRTARPVSHSPSPLRFPRERSPVTRTHNIES